MRQKIDSFLGKFLVALMAAMTIDVLWGVVTRYVMGHQASWTEELARFLMMWIGILGSAYASGQKMHLAIDLLKPKLSRINVNRVNLLIYGVVIFFALAVMVVGGLRLMYVTKILGQLSPALRVPMYMVYAVLPISGILIVYYQVLEFIQSRERVSQELKS